MAVASVLPDVVPARLKCTVVIMAEQKHKPQVARAMCSTSVTDLSSRYSKHAKSSVDFPTVQCNEPCLSIFACMCSKA